MELKIEKNVPITNTSVTKVGLILEEMEIGDSIEYGLDNFVPMRSQIRRLNQTNKYFTTRKVNLDGTKRRVWRVK